MMFQCPSCLKLTVPETVEKKVNFIRLAYECACGCTFNVNLPYPEEAHEDST
jgi:transcription elongation factor Elf1